MPNFSIPADFQVSTIEQLNKRNEKWDIPVKEVYGSLNPSIFGSGRMSSAIQSISFDQLKKYVQICNANDIEFNYTLNFNCVSNADFTQKGRKEIIKFAQKLTSIGARRFTVVLPSVIEILSKFIPEASVSVSVISNVDSPNRLRAFLSSGNVDRIIVPEFLNRKITQLKKLTSYKNKLGCEFGTIVNSICLNDCPYRDFHYTFGSHVLGKKNYLSQDYYIAQCHLAMLEHPVEILKMPWIRPENIKEYIRAGIDWFKISGREFKNIADFIKVVEIYNEGSFDGNLMELLHCFAESNFSQVFDIPNKNLDKFARRFFEETSTCTTKDCDTCNYCNINSSLVRVHTSNPWYKHFKEAYQKDLSALVKK